METGAYGAIETVCVCVCVCLSLTTNWSNGRNLMKLGKNAMASYDTPPAYLNIPNQ